MAGRDRLAGGRRRGLRHLQGERGATNWRGASDAGLLVGAYHFYKWGQALMALEPEAA